MHYRNGREAKNGDKVVKLSYEGGKIEAVGVLHDAVPGNDYCNGSIAPTLGAVSGACMCDCLHADDLAAMLKEKGLGKRRPKQPTETICVQGDGKGGMNQVIANADGSVTHRPVALKQ